MLQILTTHASQETRCKSSQHMQVKKRAANPHNACKLRNALKSSQVLIGTEKLCFDPRLCHLTFTQLPCCTGSSGTEQCKGLPELVASKAVSTALTFLLSSTKVWMRVSTSKIFSVSLTISLHLSHVNPSLLTEIDKLYMWQTVQKTIAGEAVPT